MRLNRILLVAMIVAVIVAAPIAMADQAPDNVPSTAPRPFIRVTLKPNRPAVGNNILTILVTDPTGKPIDNLTLKSTVAMTSMDMGISHPPVKPMGNGSYQTTVEFAMEGPWRVILQGNGINQPLDFDVGSGKVWTMPVLPVPTGTPPPMATQTTMPAPPPSSTPMSSAISPGDLTPIVVKSKDEATMLSSMSEMDDHPMSMPQLPMSSTVIASGTEDWKVLTGFGKSAPMVAMMNQMMIGGSPIEGMKMGAMKMDFSQANFTSDP